MESSRQSLPKKKKSTKNKPTVSTKSYMIPKRAEPNPPSAVHQATSTSQFDATNFTFFDASRNEIEYDKNAVYISLRHPGYKAVMFEEFRKLGCSPDYGVSEANTALQRFKDKGGNRFFKLTGPGSRKFAEVDDSKAIESK